MTEKRIVLSLSREFAKELINYLDECHFRANFSYPERINGKTIDAIKKRINKSYEKHFPAMSEETNPIEKEEVKSQS